jgi:hypothetical protein
MTLSMADLQSHPSNGTDTIDEVFYIIVTNRQGALVVACAQDFDLPDYSNIASRCAFNDETDAEKYARVLAKEHGLEYAGGPGILD